MTSDQIGGFVRAILAMLGGVGVTKGWIDNSTMLTIVGGIATVVVAGWSWYTNKTTSMIASVDQKPEVRGVVVTPAVAAVIDSVTVTSNPAALSPVR